MDRALRTAFAVWVLGASVVSTVLHPLDARAAGDESASPVRLTYEAHEGCPDALTFFYDVRSRTERVRPAQPGEAAGAATVRIVQAPATASRGPEQSVGTLELLRAGTPPFERRVAAGTCKEVVVALSLVFALAYDPDALSLANLSGPPALAPLPPAALPPPSAAASPPAPIAALPPDLRRDTGDATKDAGPAVPVSRPPLVAPARTAAGFLVAGMNGIDPAVRPVLGPFVEFGASGTGVFRPSAQVALLFEPDHEVKGKAGTATFGFVGGRISGCPVALTIVPRLEALPCLGFSLGKISGQGDPRLTTQKADSVGWFALSAHAVLRWDAVGPVFVEGTAGGGLTLAQPKFVMDGSVVHQVPTGYGEFGAGVGVHFP